MKRPEVASPSTQFVTWGASVVLFGFVGLAVVGATYQEFIDCSNPGIHESANTGLGWTVAMLSSLLPVALAIWLARGVRHRLPALALLVALGSLVVWQWILDADCEWYALPV